MLSLSPQQERESATFYCSHGDLAADGLGGEGDRGEGDDGGDGGVEKSASSTDVAGVEGGESDSGLGSSASYRELSRSLDFIDQVSCQLPAHSAPPRRQSQTLPSCSAPPPPAQADQLKQLSLGTAFGTKRASLGRKLSSIMSVPTERYMRGGG